MARTTTTNKATGEKFPRKSRGKNGKNKKFFGYRYGDGSIPHAKKGFGFINDGYPFDVRTKGMLQIHIEAEMLKEELKSINQ